MAEPIKTTVQEALSHIKSWIDSGEKDKAIKGLEEILSHEPGNVEAKSMLDGLNSAPTGTLAPSPAPVSIPVTPASPTPASSSTPVVTPPATPTPAVAQPSAMPSIPVPPATPPVTPAPTPTIPSSPVSPVSPPPSLEAESKIAMIMRNMKWIIMAGALLSALIGGYLFYKNFLSVPGQIAEDLQQEAEKIQSDVQAVLPENSTDSQNAEISESSEPSVSTDGNQEIIPTTSTETKTETSATTSSESGEKVKRR